MAIKEIDGLPIIDAKKPITLIVTAGDIGRADRKEPADCAVARCCRRSLHAKEVRVHLSRIYVRSNEGNWVRYMTPPSMRSEIIVFDRGGAFAPGEFVLKAPTARERLTGKRKGSNKPHKRRQGTGKPQSKPHVVTDVRAGPA